MSALKEIRLIIPQGSLTDIVDCFLALQLRSEIDELFPCLKEKEFFEGAKKHTQIMDIAHTAQMVIEKSIDNKSAGAVAQLDVKQHFDRIDILRVYD